MPSLIEIAAEETRSGLTGDKNYADKGKFVFVLHGPRGQPPFSQYQGRAQFPLVINPEVFEYTLPFAAQVTPLQEGGVVSEEGGITVGTLRLQGTTGFKVRKPLGDTSGTRGDGEFTGELDPGGQVWNTAAQAHGITGHMHFWRLIGRCFDGYSALKKNPSYAAKTRMEFHSLKDDLHLLIVPKEFSLTRSASKERVIYRFSIRADVVGAATESQIFVPSPDVSWIQGIKDTVAKLRQAVQSVSAAIDDITAAVDDIRRTITSAVGVLDDARAMVTSVTNFVEGAKSFVDIPKAAVISVAEGAEAVANLSAVIANYKPDVAQTWREVADGADRIATAARGHFAEDFDIKARVYDGLTEGYRTGKDPARDALVATLADNASSAQGRLSVETAFGQGIRAGDTKRGRTEQIAHRSRFAPGRFKGFAEKIIGQGDTLQSLAARHMGDARDWMTIAAANRLSPPYITNGAAMPGTVTVGSRIIVPVPVSTGDPDTLTSGERSLKASQAEDLLGRDFELVRLANGQYGWQIDVAGGSTSVFAVSGLANLEQAIGSRFRTEAGQNILYPNFGLPRLVGNRADEASFVSARYEMRNQLLADPRIEQVTSLRFDASLDTITMEAGVRPIGFSNERVISRQLT